jgi:hypothetical protein
MIGASKMPLLIFQPKKWTNIPEVIRYVNAMFFKVKGIWQFFYNNQKGSPLGAALYERG